MNSLSDRRIINIFRSFIEKVFVPQLPKMDLFCQQQWGKFSSMISSDPINLGQVQLYVQTLSTNNFGMNANRPNFERTENKSPIFTKIKKDTNLQQLTSGFNPSKTFGGQKARMMFPLKDYEQGSTDNQSYNLSKDFSKQKQQGFGLSTQAVLPTLQRLFKLFSDNQTKMEKIGYSQLPGNYEHKNYYN